MKILIAYEYSGIVRDAFLKKGHDAMSCDLLPTESPGPHYQGDVIDILNDGWDMMIARPPCTYLSYAATRVWNEPGRVYKRIEALKFFADLWEAPIKKICIENPKGCASPVIAKFSQEIHPYFFGDQEVKRTWLWLKNLPFLSHHENENLFEQKTHVQKPKPAWNKNGKKEYYTYKKRNPKDRSKFWPGIAQAMADQWGVEG